MNKRERNRFDKLYQQHLTKLKLKGRAPKTISAYSRAARRIAEFFDCCPDRLSTDHLKAYFSTLVDPHSRSTAKRHRPVKAPA